MTEGSERKSGSVRGANEVTYDEGEIGVDEKLNHEESHDTVNGTCNSTGPIMG
jgi:hypothetical protein